MTLEHAASHPSVLAEGLVICRDLLGQQDGEEIDQGTQLSDSQYILADATYSTVSPCHGVTRDYDSVRCTSHCISSRPGYGGE